MAGSLIGAWIGATWATRMRSATLYKVIAVLLVFIAAALATNTSPRSARWTWRRSRGPFLVSPPALGSGWSLR